MYCAHALPSCHIHPSEFFSFLKPDKSNPAKGEHAKKTDIKKRSCRLLSHDAGVGLARVRNASNLADVQEGQMGNFNVREAHILGIMSSSRAGYRFGIRRFPSAPLGSEMAATAEMELASVGRSGAGGSSQCGKGARHHRGLGCEGELASQGRG